MKSTKTQMRTIMIGPLPPPYNGQNMAFGMAVELFKEKNLPYVIINIADRTGNRADGQFTWGRVREITRSIVQFCRYVILANQVVYLTNAQTLVGFLRDSIYIWLAKCWNHRIVLHLHGGGYQEFFAAQNTQVQRFIIVTLKQAHTLIVEGKHLQKQYEFLLTPKPPIEIVHNPLAEDIMIRSEAVSERLPTAPLQILYLSNLIESKGYQDVLSAVKLLHEEGVPIEANFCGAFLKASDSAEGFDPALAEAQCKQWVADHQLHKVVTFHGIVKGKKKETLLRNAQIFILPSYYINEGQPVSIIEAMANGLVIITTAYRGIVDLVDENVNGFFVPPRNPEAIVRHVHSLYENPKLCAQMGNASLAKFQRSFKRSVRDQSLLNAIFSTHSNE